MTPEQESQKEVRLTATSLGLRLLRNNSGAYKTDEGNWVSFGLGNESTRINKEMKSSDLIGITPVVITPEMVGKTVGVFTAIEVKPISFKIKDDYPKGSREWAQKNFTDWVRSLGGFSGFARNGADVTHVINHFKNWLIK